MPERPRVLLCTSNGVGLGHVTRMMAIADELRPDADPIIFTLSAAVAIPVRAGFHVEHLASAGHLGVHASRWHDLLEDRIDQLVRSYRPSVVMFDGVHPYRGFTSGLGVHRRRLRRVWQRRAMWRPGVGIEAMMAARSFDSVIEPGEFAEEYDHGATVAARGLVDRVRPIVYGAEHRRDRDRACAELGLDPAATNVLVQLGAGQINDVDSLTGTVVQALREHGGDCHVVVARSELSAVGSDEAGDVTVVRRFPISAWFDAFDAAVLAAGYNSFHEALAMRVPTIFVPNLQTRTDDQDARSRWAVDHGMALRWDGHDHDELVKAVAQLGDSGQRTAMRTALATLGPATGATDVAELIRTWLP